MPKTIKKETEPKKKRGRPKGSKSKKISSKPVKLGKEILAPAKAIQVEKFEIAPRPKKFVKRDYHYAVGRRKQAIARVRFYQSGTGEIKVNKLDYREYFPYFAWQKIVLDPLTSLGLEGKGSFSIKVSGGGKKGQSEAIRLGIARVFNDVDRGGYRLTLKKLGYLSRDSRVKERKKYGLKRARRAPQWQKR